MLEKNWNSHQLILLSAKSFSATKLACCALQGCEKESPWDGILQCPLCGTAFHGDYRKRNLKQHMSIHRGEKPFFCPYCPHKSNRKSNLKVHITAVHLGRAGNAQWLHKVGQYYVWIFCYTQFFVISFLIDFKNNDFILFKKNSLMTVHVQLMFIE